MRLGLTSSIPGDWPTRGLMIRTNERCLLIKHGRAEGYRRVLVATDLDEGTALDRSSSVFHAEASIALLSAYRIPFRGLRFLLAAGRLQRELEKVTLERMNAFVGSSGIERSCELLARHGDLRDHLLGEIRRRDPDLVVFAFAEDSQLTSSRLRRLLDRVLSVGRCDVLLLRDPQTQRSAPWGVELLAFGMW